MEQLSTRQLTKWNALYTNDSDDDDDDDYEIPEAGNFSLLSIQNSFFIKVTMGGNNEKFVKMSFPTKLLKLKWLKFVVLPISIE